MTTFKANSAPDPEKLKVEFENVVQALNACDQLVIHLRGSTLRTMEKTQAGIKITEAAFWLGKLSQALYRELAALTPPPEEKTEEAPPAVQEPVPEVVPPETPKVFFVDKVEHKLL